MTAHIHSSATSKSTLFKRLVIITIVISTLIYLAFTFSLFSVPTKYQKLATTTQELTNSNSEQQKEGALANAEGVEVKKPTGVIVQTAPNNAVADEEKPSSLVVKKEPQQQQQVEDLNAEDGGVPPQQPVEEDLNVKTYDDFIKSSPNALVYVYSPSCGHCIQFAPTFEKLVVEMGKIYGGNVNIGKVVGPKNIDTLVIPLGVRGYPTLMFYKNGNLKSKKFYEGPRKVTDILKFIKEQIESK